MPNRPEIDAPPIAPPPAVRADEQAVGFDYTDEKVFADTSNQNKNDASTKQLPLFNSPTSAKRPQEQAGTPESQTAVTSLTRDWLTRQTPAALTSFIAHTLLLLILGMLTIVPRVGVPTAFNLESVTSEGESNSELETYEVLSVDAAAAAPADVIMETPSTHSPSAEVLDRAIGELMSVDPNSKPPKPSGSSLSQHLETATADLAIATLASTGVEGRSAENREQTARARGGTLESELAVERALEWLAAHQLPSGGWSLVHDGGKCKGQCKNNGSNSRYEPAATGLALLAFLGAGYTHESGKYQRTVNDGIYYLLQIMEEVHNSGSFLHQSERGMYNHGIATFALCEAYQLSDDEDLKQPAQQAVNFIFSAQNYAGGWGYLPKQPGDLTISGWQMMAIKSAHAAGLEVPPSVIIRIDNFLDTKQVPSGIFYGYGKPANDPTCSAIGMLLRLFRGWSHTDPRALELAQYLVKEGKSNNDVYYNYYATLLLFHLGGPSWDHWNPRIREHLIKTQNLSGHEAGSWYFEDQYAKEGGRLYTTAMCAMTLEVYYRFSPLYQQADRPFEL